MDLFPGNSAFRVIHCRVSQRLLYIVSLCLFPGHILFRFYVSDDNHADFSAFYKVQEAVQDVVRGRWALLYSVHPTNRLS